MRFSEKTSSLSQDRKTSHPWDSENLNNKNWKKKVKIFSTKIFKSIFNKLYNAEKPNVALYVSFLAPAKNQERNFDFKSLGKSRTVPKKN